MCDYIQAFAIFALKKKFKFFLNFLVFIYFCESARMYTGRSRQRQRHRIPSRRHTISPEPNMGLKPTNREIMT